MASVQNQQPRHRIWYSNQARSKVEPDQPTTGWHRRRLLISPPGIDRQSGPSPEAIRQGIERDRVGRQRIAKLTETNEALRNWLNALTATPKLGDIPGQVIAATTRQLNASSSALFIRDRKSDFVTLEFVFQDNRILSPAEVNYPENLRSYRLTKRTLELAQQPAVLVHLSRDHGSIGDAHRSYLLSLGVRTVLLIPLIVGKRLVGCLNFRFVEKRDLRPEEIEIARALAAQTSLAVQLTALAKAESQSAVLEERNRLAGEIHDSLAQNFAAIAAQLNLAREAIGVSAGASYLDRAKDFARFGLAEARRTALCLHPFVLDRTGLIGTMEMLVDRSNVPGRLRCTFSVNDQRANDLPLESQHHILRIAQEAISNAVRHANPCNISVSLRCDHNHLELRIQNDGCPFPRTDLLSQSGLGLSNMKNRARKIKATLKFRNIGGGGTLIVLKVPING